MAIIYKITNLLTNEFYIGKTKNSIQVRFKCHKKASKTSECHLHRSMRKYGIDKFAVELLEETTIDLLDEREKFYISTLNPTLNMTDGGEGGSTTHNRMWVNNGVINSYILKTDDIPKGFVKGRIGTKFSDSSFQREMSSRVDKKAIGVKNSIAWREGRIVKTKHRLKGTYKHSDETKLKLQESASKRKRIECPHCDKSITPSMALRWHFDNCKNKNK